MIDDLGLQDRQQYVCANVAHYLFSNSSDVFNLVPFHIADGQYMFQPNSQHKRYIVKDGAPALVKRL